VFGPGDVDALRRLVLRLDREGAEGVVFKEPDGVARVKYVTPASSLHDIETLAPRLAGLPPEYFVGRLVRMVAALEELGFPDEEIRAVSRRLGEHLVDGFRGAIAQFRDGHVVETTVTVRLHRASSADALLRHLDRASDKIQVREVGREWRDGWLELTFRKVHQQSTGFLDTILSGGHVYD
jgi:putative ATP-dependent DNA ligase